MADKKPIYEIAKNLCIDSIKVVEACNHIGIYAKGASKKLNNTEQEKIISHFKNGKNVANEVVDIKNSGLKSNFKEIKEKSTPRSQGTLYFPNRLIKEI